MRAYFFAMVVLVLSLFLRQSARLSCALLFGGICTVTGANTPIFETKLSNGLQVIIREDHRAPMVMSQIWYKVGSTDESGNTLGVAHVLEHMMFKGTHKVPHDEFSRLSRIYGGRINASTFTNYTNYYQLYPSQYLAMALELEADRMRGLHLQADDLKKELQVVMEERRQRTDDNPQALAFERFKWLAYPTSHYRQPIIGHMKTLNHIQLADVRTWYDRWYHPNNAVLVIVGNVKTSDALLQVQKYFGDIPAQTLPNRNDVTEFDQLGRRHMQLISKVKIPNLYMAWNVKSLVTADQPQDAYALRLIQALLNNGISSRLQQNLVREQKILTSVNVSYDLYQRGDSLLTISALPNGKITLTEAEQAILKEIENLKTNLVSQHELDRVIAKTESNLVYSQDDISGQAHLLGNLAINGIVLAMASALPEQLKLVNAQDIQRVAQKYLQPEYLSTLHLLPETAQN